MNNRNNSYKFLILILLIVFIGFIVRLYKITYQSLWLDEAYSIYNCLQPVSHIITMQDLSPPLYYLLLHYWIKIAGINELGVRLLSVVFGVLSVYVIYLIGKLMYNQRIGLFSALILALSPIHIFYSQEARTYSMLLFLSLLSMYFYLKINALRTPRNKKLSGINNLDYFLYFILSVLLIYSHIYGLFIIIIQNLIQIYYHGIKLNTFNKKWILLQLMLLFAYLPWIYNLIIILGSNAISWIPTPTIFDIIPLFYFLFSGQLFSMAGVLLIFLFIYILLKSKFQLKSKNLILYLWVIIPIFLSLLITYFITPIYTMKYLLISSFPLYILVAHSMNSFQVKYSIVSFQVKKQNIVLVVFILLSVLTILYQQNAILKDDWRSVSELVKTDYSYGDEIFVINSYEIQSFSYYYNSYCFNNFDLYGCSRDDHTFPINTINDFILVNPDQGVLVVSKEEFNDQVLILLDYLRNNYEIIDERQFSIDLFSDEAETIFDIFDTSSYNSLKPNIIRVIKFKRFEK